MSSLNKESTKLLLKTLLESTVRRQVPMWSLCTLPLEGVLSDSKYESAQQ